MKRNMIDTCILLEAIALVIVVVLTFRQSAVLDVVPPTITLPEETVTYTQGESKDLLLQGVSAVDDRNGDVTSSVMISSISVVGTDEAIVIYHAKDASNNVAMTTRSIHFIPNESARFLGVPVNAPVSEITVLPDKEAAEAESTADRAGDAAENVVESGVAEPVTADTATYADNSASSADDVLASYADWDPDDYQSEDLEKIGRALREETEAAKESLPEGSPVIGLLAHAILQDVGDSLNLLDLISQIDDAEDSIEYIFGQIHVETEEGYSTDAPGAYTVKYYVIDSDGHSSNVARLYVVVR